MKSQRRLEMERVLPEPSPNMGKFVWEKCREAGVNIPGEDMVFLMRLVASYISGTAQGKETVLKLINAKVTKASHLKTYFREGYYGMDSGRLQTAELTEYHGWIYKGMALPGNAVEVDEREDAITCDACGGRFPDQYCTKNVEVFKTGGGSRMETHCNHCRFSSEHPRIAETGSTQTCAKCEKRTCEFHPQHFGSVPLLPPARAQAPAPKPVQSEWQVAPPSPPPTTDMPPGWSF